MINKRICRWLVWVAVLLNVQMPAIGNETGIVLDNQPVILISSNQPPPGFEDLVGPQTTQIDVYYQNRPLVSTLATYTFDTIEFSNPQEIVDALDNILDATMILESLHGPLDTNTHLLCLKNTDTECGVLYPPVAGVIFDETYFRAELFINPVFLHTESIFDSRYLPESTSGLAMVNSIDINTSGGERQEDNYNVQSSSILAYKQSRIRGQLNYTNNEQFAVDELSLQHDQKDWEVEAGIFDTRGRLANFISQQDILGARLASSTNTRVDLDVAQGTPISMFLNQRSRVEVFKDNRLIDARFYEAGNQQLDSSRFPDGSYDIEVRIREEGGRERTERYFFVKTTALPPDGEPHYFVELGRIQEVAQDEVFADTTDAHLLRLGSYLRLNDQLGAEIELDNTDGQSMLQGGMLWFMPNWRTQMNAMLTTENDWGISLRNSLQFTGLAANIDFRYVDEGDESNPDRSFDFVNQTSTQAAASITHNLFGGRTSWQYRHIDRDQEPKSETISVDYRREVYRFNKLQADWTFALSKDSDDYLLQTGIRFLWRDAKTQFRLDPLYEVNKTNNDRDEDIVGSASASYISDRPETGRLRTTVFRTEENHSATNGLRLQSESQLGFHDLEVNDVHQDKQNTFSYLTNHRINVATDFKNVAIGGRRTGLSALVIDIEGPAVDAGFNVYVNRQFMGTANIGRNSVIGLRPYEEYEVSLESTGDDFVQFDESVRSVTLYPGNVVSLNYEVKKLVVIVGQVLRKDGSTVKNARIDNLPGFAGTDGDGWFQVETKTTEKLIFKPRDAAACQVKLPELDPAENLHVFDELICEPLPDTQEAKPASTREPA